MSQSQSSMISKLLCTDVLAIRCINNFVFVGVGCTLHIYHSRTLKLEKKIKCLYPYNIHGIIDGPNNKLAIFGANTICIYNITTEDGKLLIQEHATTKRLNDWIMALNWLTIKGCTYLAVLLAHNNVHIYNITEEQYQSVWCEEKCILYGGSISVKHNADLVVFSGTVFQEILIWEVKHESSHIGKNATVLHRLTGHNGVIFSVIYNPHTQMICSTSDDRTVRLWKVTDNHTSHKNCMNWDQVEVKLMKTMFGHTARVWRSIFVGENLITIGEDSLICTWSLDGKLLNKVCAHNGAAIWSIDLSEDKQNIFTGAADGTVHAWPLTSDCITKKILLHKNNSQNVLKYVCYLHGGTLLTFTEDGIVSCYNRTENDPRESLYLERYRCYCIMQVSPCRSYISFASRDGYLAIYKEINASDNRKLHRIVEEKIMESRIFSLQWLNIDTVIACGANGVLKIFNFNLDGLCIQARCLLPESRERWLTAATIFQGFLICGDRIGNLHVFELEKSHDPVSNKSDILNKPIQTLTRVHGRIGVQNLTVLDSKLMSAGRDGMLRFYEIQEHDRRKPLYTLHKEKMPMDWISGTLTVSNDILVLGFKEVEFIVFSLIHHRVTARIPCGGGHRSWDCMLINELITFTYIRSKQVFVFDSLFSSTKLPTLLNGFHVKEVYCIEPVTRIHKRNIFVSGGEDSTLRVTAVSSDKDNLDFQTLGLFDGHISSIKCITIAKVHNNSSYKQLIFSAGGRAQIKVWEMDTNHGESNLKDSNISCSDVTSHMLYGLDRYRRKPCRETSESYVVQPETRYMDIDTYISLQNPRFVLVFVAGADGYVRIFIYDIERRQIDLKVAAKCVSRCILRMRVLTFNERIIVLTMSTDGIVRCIDFTNVVVQILATGFDEGEIQNCIGKELIKFKLHQSGINAFDIKTIKDGEYLLATGGDDNLLSLISFKICMENKVGEPSVSLVSKWKTSSAHSTQITGIKFKNEKMYSVGMDQHIIIHNYQYKNNVLSVTIVDRVFTCVSDVQGLVFLPSPSTHDESLICIYGKGFEMLSC